jgi:DNA polymerase-1
MEQEARPAAYELQRAVSPAIADMCRRGFLLDRAVHAGLIATWVQELASAREAYTVATGRAAPRTSAQIREWLTEQLTEEELAGWKRTDKDNQLSTRAADLKALGLHRPGARPVLAILQHEKLISTFGPKLLEHINPVTNRIHPNFQAASTKTGRCSASGPNLQQMPQRRAPQFRCCIVAAPGRLLVGADFNQVELRSVGWLSGDDELNAIYARGGDLHREVAANILGIQPDQLTSEERARAKAVNFGSIYGLGARGLVQYAFDKFDTVLTEHEAEDWLTGFFHRFYKLAQWRRRIIDESMRAGEISIPSGRVVKAAWEPGHRIRPTQCVNFPVQGACANAMLLSLRLLHGALRRYQIDGGMIATIHDEIVAEVAEQHAQPASELLRQAMLQAFMQTFPGAPTTNLVEVKVGHNWGDLK